MRHAPRTRHQSSQTLQVLVEHPRYISSFAPGIVDACDNGQCHVTLYDGQRTHVPADQCVAIPAPWSYVQMCTYIHHCAETTIGRQVVALFDADGFYYDVWRMC